MSQKSREQTPSRSVRSRPVRNLASLFAKPHYMGDHPLFHNAVTAKRFPVLANVPQTELAAMFNVSPVDKDAVARDELMFYEAHRDKPVALRELPPLPPGAVPFRPTNSSEAKKLLSSGTPSVFTGFDADRDREERLKAMKEREREIYGELKPFTRGSTAEAQRRVAGTAYLNSLDDATVQVVRRAADRRMREQREQGLRTAYGYQAPPISR